MVNNSIEIKVPNEKKIIKRKKKSKTFDDLIVNVKYLNNFNEYITKKLIIYEKDNNTFLQEIEFIYYTIIYFFNNYKKYSKEINDFKYTLYEPEDIKYKNINNLGEKEQSIIENFEQKNMLNYSELSNIKGYDNEISIKNPINNIGKYFHFPLILEKNIITYEEKFYSDFKEFIFEIYQSKLMRQIFYIVEEFNNYYYPFDGKENKIIFQEMFENTFFYPFKTDQLQDNSGLEKIIISIYLIINTIFHEQMKHYIKALIHYNSLRLSHISPLESDDELTKESFDKYIKILKKKKELIKCPRISKEELEEIIYSDGGDKLEILLYGQKLKKLYIKAAIRMLDREYYNTSISEHLMNFINDNKSTDLINLDQELGKNSSFIRIIVNYIKNYSNRRIKKQTFLDGNCCL